MTKILIKRSAKDDGLPDPANRNPPHSAQGHGFPGATNRQIAANRPRRRIFGWQSHGCFDGLPRVSTRSGG
jgi:hypothetical protein